MGSEAGWFFEGDVLGVVGVEGGALDFGGDEVLLGADGGLCVLFGSIKSGGIKKSLAKKHDNNYLNSITMDFLQDT